MASLPAKYLPWRPCSLLYFSLSMKLKFKSSMAFSPRCPQRQPPLLLRRHCHQMRRRLSRVFWNLACYLFSQFLEGFERLKLGMGIDYNSLKGVIIQKKIWLIFFFLFIQLTLLVALLHLFQIMSTFLQDGGIYTKVNPGPFIF